MSPEPHSSLRLRVVTPRKLLLDEEVREVSLPGLEGCLGILPGHRPLFTALGGGSLAYRKEEGTKEFHVRRGFAEILADQVLVFAELEQDETDQPDPGQG